MRVLPNKQQRKQEKRDLRRQRKIERRNSRNQTFSPGMIPSNVNNVGMDANGNPMFVQCPLCYKNGISRTLFKYHINYECIDG